MTKKRKENVDNIVENTDTVDTTKKEDTTETTNTDNTDLKAEVLGDITQVWIEPIYKNEENNVGEILNSVRIDRLGLEGKDRDDISETQNLYNTVRSKIDKLSKCFEELSVNISYKDLEVFNNKTLKQINDDINELEFLTWLTSNKEDINDIPTMLKIVNNVLNITSYSEGLKSSSTYKILLERIKNILLEIEEDNKEKEDKLDRIKDNIKEYINNTGILTILKSILVLIELENLKLSLHDKYEKDENKLEKINNEIQKIEEQYEKVISKILKNYDTDMSVNNIKYKVAEILDKQDDDNKKETYKGIIRIIKDNLELKEDTIKDIDNIDIDTIKEFVKEGNTYKLYNYLFTDIKVYKEFVEAQKYIDLLYTTFIHDILDRISPILTRLYWLCILSKWDNMEDNLNKEEIENTVETILYERMWFILYIIIAIWVIWIMLANINNISNMWVLMLVLFILLLWVGLYAMFKKPRINSWKSKKWLALFGVAQFVIWILILLFVSYSSSTVIQNLGNGLMKVSHIAHVLQDRNNTLWAKLAEQSSILANTKQDLQQTQLELEDTQGKLKTCNNDKSNILNVIDRVRSELDSTYNKYNADQYNDGHENEKDGANLYESGENIPNVEMNSGAGN